MSHAFVETSVDLARVLAERGELAEAAAVQRAVVAALTQLDGGEAKSTAEARRALAETQKRRGLLARLCTLL